MPKTSWLNPLKQTATVSYSEPLLQLDFVLSLLLLSDFLVAVLLLQRQPLPAAADLSHPLFHREVIQLSVGQHLLRELLISVSKESQKRGEKKKSKQRFHTHTQQAAQTSWMRQTYDGGFLGSPSNFIFFPEAMAAAGERISHRSLCWGELNQPLALSGAVNRWCEVLLDISVNWHWPHIFSGPLLPFWST